MRFVKQTLTGDIIIDDHSFVDCKFENARLIYQGGPFELVGGEAKNVETLLVGAAHNTVSFLRMIRGVDSKCFEALVSGQSPPVESKKPAQAEKSRRRNTKP